MAILKHSSGILRSQPSTLYFCQFLYNPRAVHWQTLGNPLETPIFRPNPKAKPKGIPRQSKCNPTAIGQSLSNPKAIRSYTRRPFSEAILLETNPLGKLKAIRMQSETIRSKSLASSTRENQPFGLPILSD